MGEYEYIEFSLSKDTYQFWCDLLGMEIQGSTVRVTPEFLKKHYSEINGIQMVAGFMAFMRREGIEP